MLAIYSIYGGIVLNVFSIRWDEASVFLLCHDSIHGADFWLGYNTFGRTCNYRLEANVLRNASTLLSSWRPERGGFSLGLMDLLIISVPSYHSSVLSVKGQVLRLSYPGFCGNLAWQANLCVLFSILLLSGSIT